MENEQEGAVGGGGLNENDFTQDGDEEELEDANQTHLSENQRNELIRQQQLLARAQTGGQLDDAGYRRAFAQIMRGENPDIPDGLDPPLNPAPPPNVQVNPPQIGRAHV